MLPSTRPFLDAAIAAGAVIAVAALTVQTQTVKDAAPCDLEVSADFPSERKRILVAEAEMACANLVEKPVVLFPQGNSTYSRLWLNDTAYVNGDYHGIAPALIETRDSDTPNMATRSEITRLISMG